MPHVTVKFPQTKAETTYLYFTPVSLKCAVCSSRLTAKRLTALNFNSETTAEVLSLYHYESDYGWKRLPVCLGRDIWRICNIWFNNQSD